MSTTIITRVYKPAVDGGSSFPTVAPVTAHSKTVTLTYPYISPTLSLIIRGPELQNKQEPYQRRILRNTRGGTTVCFRDSMWPQYTRLSYAFAALRQSSALAFQSFVLTALGYEVGLLDFNGQQWRGYISSPEAEISQLGRGCQWSGRLTLEVQLV